MCAPRVRLCKEHEHGRDERGKRGVVDPPHGDSGAGEREQQASQDQRLPDEVHDERGYESADHRAAHALQPPPHRSDGVRLQDDDDRDRHPVAPLEPKRSGEELRRGRHDGDPERMPQLDRSRRKCIAQRCRCVGRRERSRPRWAFSPLREGLGGLHRVAGLRLDSREQRRQFGIRLQLRG